jgi:AraC-like DNA-binding protein
MMLSRVQSLSDWRLRGPLAARPQLHRSVVPEPRRIDAGPVHLMNILCPAGLVVDPPVPEVAVHLVLRTPPLLQVGFNRRPRWLVMSPGVLLAAPPDTAGDFDADRPSHVLTITIPRAHVDDFTRDSGARIDIRREETFRAPRLAQQITRLWHMLVDDEPASRLFADQVMREVMGALARRTEAHRPARNARERLSPFVLRRLCDHVESHLAEDLDVPTLARVAALSPAHFARAFAATSGMTPFQYVITRRLARAYEFLARTDRSALDIALDVGFKTPSHFASRFRREFGVTPREIRPGTRRRDHRVELDLPDAWRR